VKALVLTLAILMSFSVSSSTDTCNCGLDINSIFSEDLKSFSVINESIKANFKKRAVTTPGYLLALNVETNFEAPLIGKDIYWGRIYFKESAPDKIMYRDDLIAHDNYNKEKENPALFYFTNYKVGDINSPQGLSLIKAAGAEVNVKSHGAPFSTKTGGRLAIKVKAPKEKAITMYVDVVRKGNQIQKFLLVNNKSIPFDSFKINASKTLITGTSILNGIDNVQFTSYGKVVHTIIQ
jgi:hypothetical protein